tara:strand:+ start:487 stop:2472 length:1986 start_codon:yes stop_codon:yes gene_type:complete
MFNLTSDYKPTGDQPEAIKSITDKLLQGTQYQCLHGVTGSGKTFTMANVVNNLNNPVLVLSHNKTLAAQLYEEFKVFFPKNAIEYFVSYYDYYQPEAYLPSTNTYIEKDLSINDEIEKFRLSTTSSLLSGRKDVIVVASVSCIYGMGNPTFFKEKTITIKQGQKYNRKNLLNDLIEAQYRRVNSTYIERGDVKLTGDTIIIYPSNQDVKYKIQFWGDEIEKIEQLNNEENTKIKVKNVQISPANLFVTSKNNIQNAIKIIKRDLTNQVNFFIKNNQPKEAQRLEQRVNYDLEMIKELGYCTGIENYSRYFDGRKKGERPFCLMDYFPKDFLLIIDESHVTIPQLRAMHGGDQARKKTLVEYGFRLPAALENRPLSFDEFEKINKKNIFISATPGEYELSKSGKLVTEQLIRPTGLLEPTIIIRSSKNQIDDLLQEIHQRIKKQQRVLVTTLTKKMAEQLSRYLIKSGIKSTYIHSDVDTIERVEIMKNLRLGNIDVLIGVNLLREGLDLPEVSLVAIIDADKEGFLRSRKSLIQTIGRAARHIEGQSILYADKITTSIQEVLNETHRKRQIQEEYNRKYNIKPRSLNKKIQSSSLLTSNKKTTHYDISKKELNSFSEKDLKIAIQKTKKRMNSAAISMNFIDAAKHRDNMFAMQKRLKQIT